MKANLKIKVTDTNSFKIGKPVKGGATAIIPSKNGKEETGKLVYKRKVEYRHQA